MSQLNNTEWKTFLKDSQNYTCDNYYNTDTNQFIIETEHPDWKEYLRVFTDAFQRSEYPDRVQYSIDPNFKLDITGWIDKKLKQHLN